MSKSAFTMFEVIISLVILSIVLSSILKLFTTQNNTKIYIELHHHQNNFTSTGKISDSENIKFIELFNK